MGQRQCRRTDFDEGVMDRVSGTTSNGFDYTAHYDSAANDSVCWAATYRMDGIYRGMRHGRLFDVSELSTTELQKNVRHEIESTWINEY